MSNHEHLLLRISEKKAQIYSLEEKVSSNTETLFKLKLDNNVTQDEITTIENRINNYIIVLEVLKKELRKYEQEKLEDN
jgi:hypothetical protein